MKDRMALGFKRWSYAARSLALCCEALACSSQDGAWEWAGLVRFGLVRRLWTLIPQCVRFTSMEFHDCDFLQLRLCSYFWLVHKPYSLLFLCMSEGEAHEDGADE